MGSGDGPARARTLPQHLGKQTLGRCGGGSLPCQEPTYGTAANSAKISAPHRRERAASLTRSRLGGHRA